MKNLFESLDLTERAIGDLRTFLHSLPLIVVRHWDYIQPEPWTNPMLVQLFPDDTLRDDAELRLRTAKMIARAWGGTWTKDNGRWEGRRPLGDRLIGHSVIVLYRVEPQAVPALVDLSDPSLDAVESPEVATAA